MHRGRQCTCSPCCFFCIEKKDKGKGAGHNALSHSCPLRSTYCLPAPTTVSDPDGNVWVSDAQSLSEAETLPPTLGASGPFTLVLETRSAKLVELHQQGVSTADLCHSLLSPEEIADLESHINE